MNIHAAAARLRRELGDGDLAGQLHLLRPAQRKIIADFAHQHGFLPAAQTLYINIDELERCLVEAGYMRCETCDEFFASAQVTDGMCAGCASERW